METNLGSYQLNSRKIWKGFIGIHATIVDYKPIKLLMNTPILVELIDVLFACLAVFIGAVKKEHEEDDS